MARSFNGTSDFLSNSTLKDAFGGATAATLAGWVSRDSAGRTLAFGFSVGTSYAFYVLWYNGDNKIYAVNYNGGGAASCYGATEANMATGWMHLAMVFDGSGVGNAGRLKLYVDGVAQTLGYVQTCQATIPSSANLSDFRIGRDVNNSLYSNGAHAEVGAWTAALSPSEVAALAKGFPPHRVRLANLAAYLPLIRDVVDLKGNAWTTTGTSVTTHPRRIG